MLDLDRLAVLRRFELQEQSTPHADLPSYLREARQRRVSVVIDAGSLAGNSFLEELGNTLDGVLLVLESGRCRPVDAAETVARLRRAKIPILGAVLNRKRRGSSAIPNGEI
jgi:Mrp family chromosome partitioning ATPase